MSLNRAASRRLVDPSTFGRSMLTKTNMGEE